MPNLYICLHKAQTCTYKVNQCMKTEEFLWEKWPPALSTKWLKPSVFGYKNRSIYTHAHACIHSYIHSKPVLKKLQKLKGIGHFWVHQASHWGGPKKKKNRGEGRKILSLENIPPHKQTLLFVKILHRLK